MTMNALERKTINEGAKLAKYLVQVIKPKVDAYNVDYDTQTTGVKYTVDQAALDGEDNLSELTKQELDDAMYVITATMKAALDAGFVQLEKLASRAENFTPYQQF